MRLRDDGSGAGILYVNLPAAKLSPGRVALRTTFNGGPSAGEREHRFEVAWPQRPMSLTKFDLAVDALQHIMPPAEFERLKDEGSSEAADHFRRFWAARSVDSSRAWNPVMLEYYRRVDETLRRYSVRSEPNGYKIDRGRILILFGPPTRVDRSLRSGSGPMETWTYDRLRKRFTFSDPDRTGVYVLIRTEEL